MRRIVAAVLMGCSLAAVAAAAAPAEKAPAPDSRVPSSAPIDINSASARELAELPGIGPARAAAIVKGRPYRAKSQLRDRKILPPGVYEAIEGRIVARHK